MSQVGHLPTKWLAALSARRPQHDWFNAKGDYHALWGSDDI